MRTIVVVGVDGCLGSGFLGLLDFFRLARSALDGAQGCESFDVIAASIDGAPVLDGAGRTHPVDADLARLGRCAALIVPGFVPDENGCLPSLGPAARASAWIREQHGGGALACGSCSGTFLLGEAGLLSGRRCTTTWWLHDALRSRFPEADVAFGAALVEDRRVVTAGGPLSWVDIALRIVRNLCGTDAARRAADFAVVDTTPQSQAAYVPIGHLQASDPFVVEAERLLRASGMRLTATELARRLGTSERTLHRRLVASGERSPGELIERVRFDLARTKLENSRTSIKRIAADLGYADEASFRRAFRRRFGLSPSRYRVRYSREAQDGDIAG